MKILVCISHVPDTTSKINFTKDFKKFDKDGVQFVINPYDELTLTRAIWFKEQQGANVTVLHVGDATCENSLRKALAIGIDQAVRIDAHPENAYFVAVQIANFVKQEPFDLILTGKESIDYNGGMVGGILSAILDIPFINACTGLEIEEKTATAKRETEGGFQKLSCDLPLIVAGQRGLVEEKDSKIPSMKGIMMARKKSIKIIEPIATGKTTETIFFEKPEKKSNCQIIDSKDLDKLIDLLHNKEKVI